MNKKKSKTIWLTGLSGSGKSTISLKLKEKLDDMYISTIILDADELRLLWPELKFTIKDRSENVRRIAKLAAYLNSQNITTIVCAISPLSEQRTIAKRIIGQDEFVEIYLLAPLELCKSRDPKGLYEQYKKGIIKNFVGIDIEYEIPLQPFLLVDTLLNSPDECAAKILGKLFSE